MALFTSSIPRPGQICPEIVDVLETDVQADDAMAVVRAILRGAEIVSDGQAGHACPTVGDLEQLQGIHKCQNLRLGRDKVIRQETEVAQAWNAKRGTFSAAVETKDG